GRLQPLRYVTTTTDARTTQPRRLLYNYYSPLYITAKALSISIVDEVLNHVAHSIYTVGDSAAVLSPITSLNCQYRPSVFRGTALPT
ncbi:MAG: hypothetical protein QXY12_05505, partial [Pyrobaculum sp.]